MVIYDLICPWGHKFEGWFPNPETYDTQQQRGLVQCQVCSDPQVRKVPSGPHFAHASPPPVSTRPEEAMRRNSLQTSGGQTTGKGMAVTGMVDQVTVAKALRYYVRTHFENVGGDFAKVAREIHQGEAPPRNVYGEVTAEEAAKLNEEEIPHLVLPTIPPEFEN